MDVAAPCSGEGEPVMMRRTLLAMLYIIARFGEEGNGGAVRGGADGRGAGLGGVGTERSRAPRSMSGCRGV